MKRIPVILFGAGGVGSALLRQIVRAREQIAARNNIQFDIVAVTDSKTWCRERNGLSDEQLMAIVAAKQQGLTVDPNFHSSPPEARERPSDHGVLDAAGEANLENAIIIDATAADGMESVLKHALNLGYRVVLANKKPLAGPWDKAEGFYDHPRVRHEATVGGGQPVIATLRYLLDVNDPIYEIEGQMSGTWGFICHQLDQNMPFSTAVAAAKASGYTEPDPREDLSGMDVIRKVMILGRMAGWPLEISDIKVDPLFTPEMQHLSVAEFMTVLPELDPMVAQRLAEATAKGEILRYISTVREDGGSVSLKSIPANSSLANLKYISFCTGRYNDEPLLLGGKGAGVEMTAAGILGDMINLVRET